MDSKSVSNTNKLNKQLFVGKSVGVFSENYTIVKVLCYSNNH